MRVLHNVLFATHRTGRCSIGSCMMLQSVIHILFHYTYITDSTNSEYLYAIDFTGIHFDVSRAWLAAEVKAGLRFISWLHTDIQSKDS